MTPTTTGPDELSFERAAVLPMAVSTAASGMFQQEHPALRLPPLIPRIAARQFAWGTSVGSSAIQPALFRLPHRCHGTSHSRIGG